MSKYNIIDDDFDGSEFINNPEPRCPVLLLVDTSYSMSGEPIQLLNDGLEQFKQEVMADSLTKKRLEISVISFNSSVETVNEFCTVDNWIPPKLTTSGCTEMGAAIRHAVDTVNQRKQEYSAAGIAYYRPWIFLMTDGAPTDSMDGIAELIKDGEAKKTFMFFPIGIGDSYDKDTLNSISKRQAIGLKALKFKEFFLWLSSSLSSVSRSQPGESVALANPTGPDGWGTVD